MDGQRQMTSSVLLGFAHIQQNVGTLDGRSGSVPGNFLRACLRKSDKIVCSLHEIPCWVARLPMPVAWCGLTQPYPAD